ALDDVRCVYDDCGAAVASELGVSAASRSVLGAVSPSDAALGRTHWDAFLTSWSSAARDWGALEATLQRCQEFFSGRGVAHESWLEVGLLVQALLSPRLLDAYGADGGRMAAALGALQRHTARVLSTLGRGCSAARERELRQAEKAAELATVRFRSLAESGM